VFILIKLENIYKRYGKVEVLSNINLTINKGEVFGIIGYSGAGKSTLIRLINGLETVTQGSLTIDGVDITQTSKSELRSIRKNIGMIFQNFNLLTSKNVYKNIAFPLELAGVPKPIRKKRVQELISLVKLDGKENFYPKQLSGGQKQRVGIARALASNPSILLCDEATSALDPSTTGSILSLIKNIQKETGLTVVLITHEMDVISAICDRVAVMERGKIVEIGDVKTVFANPQQQITKDFVQKGYHHLINGQK
jgi:D-methionine transport system ATP-binding protein